MNNWVSLLDFQTVVTNNRSIIKTDGSGLSLLAMRPVLVVQLRSSHLKGRQPRNSPIPGRQQASSLLLCGSSVRYDGDQASCKPEVLFRSESGAEQ